MPKNALEWIDFWQSEDVLQSLFQAILDDPYVRGLTCAELITKERVRSFLDCLRYGVEYAVRKWGENALPQKLFFASITENERRTTHDRMWFHGTMFTSPVVAFYAEVGVTYYFVAKMIDAQARGKRYYNDHTPEGYYVDVRDGIALCIIEECCHTLDFNEGKLQGTTVDREDLSEADVLPIIAEVIRELQMPLYPSQLFQNIVYIA